MAGPVLTQPVLRLAGHEPLPGQMEGTPVWQLVRDLTDRGERVGVVTLDQATTAPVVVYGEALDFMCGPYRARHRMRDLMRVERRAVRDGLLCLEPDLVHAHWCYEYALGALATGLPTLVTVRDWAPTIVRLMPARARPYWTGRAVMFFITLARARYLTVNSPYLAVIVRRFSRAAIEIVPNGLPDAGFVRERSEHPSSVDRPPLIVSVNNGFGPLKNVRRLLEAFQALRQKGLDCRLSLVGDDYEPGGTCEAWARQRRLATGVAFLGRLPRERVLDMMARATVLAHPSREESFGMTLIEAMSQRLAVVGGQRSGAVPWVLGGGKAGLLVDIEDPRALAGAIEAVVTQSLLRERLANDGYDHAWQNFRQSRVTDLFSAVYERLLAEEARR